MCRVLGISEQGYYRFPRRPEKGQSDQMLLEQIYECLREDEYSGAFSITSPAIGNLYSR